MHLASASARLPSALFLIGKYYLGTLHHFAMQSDWSMERLYGYLKQAEQLPCCKKPMPAGVKKEDLPQIHLAIILAHRDEFGHGEVGDGKDVWRKYREQHFRELLRCRISEAQLRLILW